MYGNRDGLDSNYLGYSMFSSGSLLISRSLEVSACENKGGFCTLTTTRKKNCFLKMSPSSRL